MEDPKVKGETIELEGISLVMPPLPLVKMSQIKSLLKGGGVDDEEFLTTLVRAVHWSLKRNYKELTEEFVADNLDTANYQEILQKFMKVNHFTAAPDASGEVPGMPTQS